MIICRDNRPYTNPLKETTMAKYVLDMTKPHRQSFIELVNNDNVATIGSNLTLADVILKGERELAGQELTDIARSHALTLENANYAADFVEVFFNKIQLADVMSMTEDDGDFDWYAPDDWDPATSPAQALAAFKAAAVRAGVDPETAMENIAVDRYMKAEENSYYLTVTVTSLVFHGTVEFRMPKHFSEVVTKKDLNGFIYSPILVEDVVE